MITTPRLQLWPVDPAQAEALAEGRSLMPSVADYPHADTSAAARLARSALEVDNFVPGYGMYLIVADGLVIGDIGFHAPPDERGVVEIGYGLAPSARGRGYGAEALEALVAWAFENGTALVIADTDADNTASMAVLESAGFTRTRRQRVGERVRYQRRR